MCSVKMCLKDPLQAVVGGAWGRAEGRSPGLTLTFAGGVTGLCKMVDDYSQLPPGSRPRASGMQISSLAQCLVLGGPLS